tara:strand:+ start:150 stop:341 length:192 start_codon:yes stop_codon:yes gene_type:complete
MFGVNNIDFSELQNLISQTKEECEDTICVGDLIYFLQEQIELLEDECYEKELDKEDFLKEEEE